MVVQGKVVDVVMATHLSRLVKIKTKLSFMIR